RFLESQLSLDGALTFAKDWEVTGVDWRYTTGRAVNSPTFAGGGSTGATPTLAFSNYHVSEGAVQVSVAVFPQIQGTAGPVGILFNAVDANDYWLFGFSAVQEAGGGLTFSDSNLILEHFKNGVPVPQERSFSRVDGFIPATQIDFLIRRR